MTTATHRGSAGDGTKSTRLGMDESDYSPDQSAVEQGHSVLGHQA
jgi:hypothetical protein